MKCVGFSVNINFDTFIWHLLFLKKFKVGFENPVKAKMRKKE